MSGQCNVDGCERDSRCRGMCGLHYARAYRRNELPSIPAPIDRLMARVIETPGPLATDCWISTFADNGRGYTSISLGGGRKSYAHRATYEHFVGPIPGGHELDHLCRNSACVNPEHLEPVTHRENCLRGQHRSSITYRTNVCQRGHSMDDAYIDPRGNRRCRECLDAYSRRRRGIAS